MALFPWQLWFEPAIKVADNSVFADGLRRAAQSGDISPEMLIKMANLFDPPPGYKGPTARLVRPKGGRSAKFDTIEIGREAYLQVKAGKRDGVVITLAKKFGCDERTVRRALDEFTAYMEMDIETED